MSSLHALPSFLVHLCVLLCMSLNEGTQFGGMVAPFQLVPRNKLDFRDLLTEALWLFHGLAGVLPHHVPQNTAYFSCRTHEQHPIAVPILGARTSRRARLLVCFVCTPDNPTVIPYMICFVHTQNTRG